MNLINELQISAEEDDVLTVLRKTKRLASKLGRTDIAEWLNAEQGGYPSGKVLPDYRIVKATLAYNTNGYIPAGYGYLKQGVEDLPAIGLDLSVPVPTPISGILSMIESLNARNPDRRSSIFFPVDEGTEFCHSIRSIYRIAPEFSEQITFLLRINTSLYKAIPEHIKDRVLTWACDLEAAGVNGEGMSFTAKEKEISHSITFNLNNCTVEQLNNMGTNRKC